MRKPTTILDRETEWGRLAEIWSSDAPELVFVLGRRRVGKSFLLAPFCRAVGGVYHQATLRSEAEQLRELSLELGRVFEDPALLQGSALPDWSAIFRYVRDRAEGEPFLLVLDEFPYLAGASPSLPSVLQAFVDHEIEGSRLKIILAGSHITAMRRLEAADQPLYSRRTARLLLSPFDYLDAARFVPDLEPADHLRLYAAFGGVPGHLAISHRDLDVAESIARGILDPASRLYDEAQHMLDAFLAEARVHYSVVEAIAAGQQTWSGITRFVGKTAGSLSRPMSWLQDMEIVRRVVPVTESIPQRSKRAVYRIDDPYVRFWHRFVGPLTREGIGPEVPPERVYRARVRPALDDFLGPVFEEACRAFARRSGRLPFAPLVVGEWWNHTNQHQIDVVALSDGDEALVGECKWGKVASRDLTALRERATAFRSELGRPVRLTYALFSGRGPADGRLRDAIASGEVLHFGLEDLYGRR